MSDPNYAESIAKAKSAIADVEAKASVVLPAALDIMETAKSLATSREVDITSILTGDPITDRSLMEAADVQAAIGRTIDWSQVPDAAFSVAWSLLKVAIAFA